MYTGDEHSLRVSWTRWVRFLRITVRSCSAKMARQRNTRLKSTLPAARQAPDSPIPVSVVRTRALALGIVCVALDNYWVIEIEKVRHGPAVTTTSLFANAIFVLVVLLLLNAAVRRFSSRHALSGAELLCIYGMVCVGSAIAGHDMMPILIQMMAYPARYGTPENNWTGLFGKHLPDWLMVNDPTVLNGYYSGHSSLYSYDILSAWLAPAVLWILCLLVILFTLMCVNVLVRRQWMDRERLTFPVAQLPIAMTETNTPLWRNSLLWVGVAIAGGIEIVNGAAYYWPSVPEIPVRFFDLQPFLGDKPWSAIGWTPCSFYPFAIGLGFLMPVDLLFSSWFFYLLTKAQLILSSANGWDANPQFPYLRQQGLGGYMGLVAALVWAGRGYLKQVWLRIIGAKAETDDADEAMSYRSAAFGALAGVAALVLFFHKIGLSPLWAVLAFAIYFALSVAVARMRAELGPPVHDLYMMGPHATIPVAAGTQNVAASDLTGLLFLEWFNRAYRGHPMAIGMESMKMAQMLRANQQKFFVAIMISGLVGGISTFWIYLHRAYQVGTATGFWLGTQLGGEPFYRLESWLRNPQPADQSASAAMVFGFGLCVFLGIMRTRIVGWPLHPIGFALASDWSMNLVWVPILLAWVLKVNILRFGGLRLYRQATPLFYGLILGQMVIGSAWTFVGIIFNTQTYCFWGL